MKTRTLLILLGIAIFISAPFVVPIFSQWSRINSREQEVDVQSGQRRDTRYVYWIAFDRKVTDTPLSDVLSEDSLPQSEPRWEYVNAFGPYTRHSPHYIYHGAFNQIRQLQLIWTEFDVAAGKRRESALGLLHEWQTTGSDSSAADYIQEQMKIAEQGADGDAEEAF